MGNPVFLFLHPLLYRVDQKSDAVSLKKMTFALILSLYLTGHEVGQVFRGLHEDPLTYGEEGSFRGLHEDLLIYGEEGSFQRLNFR